jgi:hypothetical protein
MEHKELLQNKKTIGKETKQRTRKRDPLAEIMQSQREEIERYKWIESAKAGHDIGRERAVREWMQNHFQEWKRHHWDRAIEDALSRNPDVQAIRRQGKEGRRVYVEA